MLLVKVLLIIFAIKSSRGSPADRAPAFTACMMKCSVSQCLNPTNNQDWEVFGWNCNEHCKYDCMWLQVNESGKVEKYYGKWPFKRVGPFQELASCVFSLMNLFLNIFGIINFRARIPDCAPFYLYHHFQCLVMCTTWVFSFMFHAKDTKLTERLDYSTAFSYIALQMSFFIVRMTWIKHRRLCKILYSVLIAIVLKQIAHFCSGNIDYQGNMVIIATAVVIWAIGWHTWYLVNRKTNPHALLPVLFVDYSILIGVLEIFDFAPLMHLVDSHAVWHMLTGPMILMQYSFYMNDSFILYKRTKNSRILYQKV